MQNKKDLLRRNRQIYILRYRKSFWTKKWSGRWESNPQHQLGRLEFYH